MVKLNVSPHLVRAAAVSLVLAPMLGAGLAVPASAGEAEKCEDLLLSCIIEELKEGSDRLTAEPTKPPVAGETLALPND